MNFKKVIAFALATALAVPGVAQAANRLVRVNNYSPVAVTHVYATNTYNDNFGTYDLLGSDVIYPGHFEILDINDGSGACVMDIKAVGSDGRVWVKYHYDVCAATDWNLLN